MYLRTKNTDKIGIYLRNSKDTFFLLAQPAFGAKLVKKIFYFNA